MPNQFKTAAETPGLNVQGNEVIFPAGSLAVADNVSYGRDDIISMRFGFEACKFFLPVAKPESLFVTGDNLYVHINNQLWYLKFPLDCIYTQIKGLNSASLNTPMGVYYFNNRLMFTETTNVVRYFDFNTLYAGTTAGTSGGTGSTDGIGAAARFDKPSGIYFDSTYAYVCDSVNETIRRIELASSTVTTIAGLAGASGSANGIGAAARFNNPQGIWGNATYLYIVDKYNYTIRRLEIATNTVTTIAGTAGAAGSTDGIGAAARFSDPSGIWGNATYLYIADSQNDKIRRLEIATNTVTTIAGSGTAGDADGIGTAAEFSYPQFITGDSTHLYVTDGGVLSGGFTIRKIEIATNNVTTLAGVYQTPGSQDGTGSGAQFDHVLGIANDTSYLYVCDQDNQAIRRINKITGQVDYFVGDSTSMTDVDGSVLTILSGPNG